jgi:hypothetical protein
MVLYVLIHQKSTWQKNTRPEVKAKQVKSERIKWLRYGNGCIMTNNHQSEQTAIAGNAKEQR